jgi:hypothetical protein
MSFEHNVFINCPFDQKFKKFLEPLLFTVIYCDFNPLISQTIDSGSVRLNNILSQIKDSMYSIHDLSRMEASKAGEISRFNMPFELGIEIGIRNSDNKKYAQKKCLILDSQKYRYQAALSDISGNDIEIYNSKIQKLIRIVRNWLSSQKKGSNPGPKLIWENYNEFKVHYQETLISDGFSQEDIKNLPKSEFIILACEWISTRKHKNKLSN